MECTIKQRRNYEKVGPCLEFCSVAEVQSRTDAENQNRQNRTESSVQSGSGSPVLAAVQFLVLRIPEPFENWSKFTVEM